jgi:hypothetical protein
MANTFAPFGFRQYSGNGGAPTYAQVAVKIKSDYTTPIFNGDAVLQDANGYITQAGDAPTTQLAGVFAGCKYLSVSQKRTVWSNYWPGSDNNGDVEAYIINDPNALFIAQASSSLNVTQAAVGASISLAGGAASPGGNTATGQSGMYLNTIGTSSTAPFRVVSLVTDPPGANGTDIASNADYVVVAFLNVSTKTLVTI